MGSISLKKVSKHFGEHAVIPSLDLEIGEGEFVVFVGPSGCGKSTLLRLIAGLEDLSGGAISIDGRDVIDNPPASRGLSMVFQSYALYPHMSVRGIIAFPLKMAGLHHQLKTTMIYITHDQVEAKTMADKIVVLNRGKIEQVGSPMVLYKNPGNLFVAGFIGSPKMNFLTGALAEAHGASTVGIRPEHLLLSATNGSIKGKVGVTEHLGPDTFVHVHTEDAGTLTVRTPGEFTIRHGESFHVEVDPSRLHRFDKNGVSIT